MKFIYNLKITLPFLFCLFLISSCTDQDIIEPGEIEIPEQFSEDYAMNFVVTLDDMGSEGDSFNPLRKEENYIDPEKFRVLFFDKDEKFLFESKSRWVKKLVANEEYYDNGEAKNVWYVSVPFFSFGNDEDYDWDWVNIRNSLTSGSFKIALLVNRPLLEYAENYTGNGIDGDGVKGWFPNHRPDWGKSESLYNGGTSENINARELLDLHHSQFDPLYLNKNIPEGYSGEGFYNFIMGDADVNAPQEPKLSSFVSWVDWSTENTSGDNKIKLFDSDCRKAIEPTEDHPIPMYGVQEFKQIDPKKWKKGTPFTLTRKDENGNDIDHPISLLRSAVKLELVFPSKRLVDGSNNPIDWILLMYSNIYSRCEPMDVWTPTDQLWKDDHNDGCEFDLIWQHGPIVTTNHTTTTDGEQFNWYRESISWLYGSWKAKGWQFGSFGTAKIADEDYTTQQKYPHIFNPCIQRNNSVYVYGEDFKDRMHLNEKTGNYHIMIYTGERNINDPSNFIKLGSTNAGSRTIIYWAIKYKDNNTIYNFPIADYNVLKSNTTTRYYNWESTYRDQSKDDEKITAVTNPGVNEYANYIADPDVSYNVRPYPLLRNHVYRLILGTGTATKSGGSDMFNVSSEHHYTKDISYSVTIKSDSEE